jgi:hypothetical protein
MEQSEKKDIESPVATNRSVRRSRRSVAFVDIEEKDKIESSESVACEKPRRSTRNRSAASLNPESDAKEMTPKSGRKSRRSVVSPKRTSSDSGIDLKIPSKENTPTNKKKQKSRNKSFGGFR